MINTLLPHSIGISVSYPLPGTKFYENVKADLKEKTNWTDSDELLLMFRNTYPPGYYKKLHRYVHHVFRKQQGWVALRNVVKNPFTVSRADFKKIASACLHMPSLLLERMQLNRYVHE